MEKLSREKLLAKRLMEDVGLEKPSVNFSANLMNAIRAKQVITEYKPLISSKSWVFVASFCVILFSAFYLVNSDFQVSLGFQYLKTLSFPSIPSIEISKTMSYAIGFVSLFLLQIPFLKGLMERQFKY